LPNDHVAGRISYLRAGQETGREWFEMIGHADSGAHTLRAFCEMDDVGLTRDVTYFLDADLRPVDAFCRVTAGGAVKGSALFLCDYEGIACEARTSEAGRMSQTLRTGRPAAYLGLHPLVGDALASIPRGTSRPGEFIAVEGFTNSISPNGDQGLHAMPVSIEVAYIGEERVTVPAGEFDTRRYALRWSPDWPPADLWVCGPQALFVRLSWSLVDATYELAELTRRV